MSRPLRILGIHGLGDHRRSKWANDWRQAIAAALDPDAAARLEFIPFRYDEVFARVHVSPADACRALRKLLRSGLRGASRVERLSESTRWLRWYAGYVVAWVENADFRNDVGRELRAAVAECRPQCIVAHSLGSLISYDVLSSVTVDAADSDLRRHLIYVTLGSQLANQFVSGNLAAGRVGPLNVAHWYHLYNQFDDVFTAPLSLPGCSRFDQIDTPFNIDGWADHDAIGYLSHPATAAAVWSRFSSAGRAV